MLERHFLSSFLDTYFNSGVLELYHGANLLCFTRFFCRGAIESNVNRNDFTELLTRWSISVELGFLKNLLVILTDNTGLNVNGINFLKFSYSTVRSFFISGIYSEYEKFKGY